MKDSVFQSLVRLSFMMPLLGSCGDRNLGVHDYDKPFPQKPGAPCIHHIYKDPNKIPEKYYEYIGMQDK
jgi:hypothetical protein